MRIEDDPKNQHKNMKLWVKPYIVAFFQGFITKPNQFFLVMDTG